MNVLVACEFSGIVREAFRKRGHNAFSCDLLPTEIPSDNHIQMDVLELLAATEGYWDLMIAHPPCTHLCSSGAVYWPEKQKSGVQQKSIDFVLRIAESCVPSIAIENPTGILSSKWRKPDQIIHPFHFGDPFMKRTAFWLKGLPLLIPTDVVEPVAHWHGGVRRGGVKKDGTRTVSKLPTALTYGEKERSRTFQGIADAMAEQWGNC